MGYRESEPLFLNSESWATDSQCSPLETVKNNKAEVPYGIVWNLYGGRSK